MTQGKVMESVHTPEVRDSKSSGHGTSFIKSCLSGVPDYQALD